jgi:hypothetical protein
MNLLIARIRGANPFGSQQFKGVGTGAFCLLKIRDGNAGPTETRK